MPRHGPAPTGARSEGSRWWPWVAVSALCVYLLTLVVWLVLPKHGEDGLWANVFAMPVAFIAGVLCLRVARHPDIDPDLRQAFLLFAAALGCDAVGDAAWAVMENVYRADPSGTWVDIPYLSYYPLMTLGLLRVRVVLPAEEDRRAAWLDLATTFLGGALLLWYFVLRPCLAAGVGDLQSLLPAAYPIGDLMLLAGLSRLVLRRMPPQIRRPLDLIALMLGLNLVGDLLRAILSAQDGYETGGMADALWIVAHGLMCAAALLARSRPSLRPDRGLASQPRFTLAPYVAVLMSHGLVMFVAVTDGGTILASLTSASVAMTALVIARQILTVRQVAELQAQQATRTSELRFRSLVQNSSDAIIVLTSVGVVRYASSSVHAVLGHEPEQLVGRALHELVCEEDRPRLQATLDAAPRTTGSTELLEWRAVRADGRLIQLESVVTNLLADASVGGLVLNTRDVTERRQLEDRLRHQAFHDQLTGLPNRALFKDRVDQALARALRAGHDVCALFVDLDNFKTINDGLGHEAGDRILLASAERLRRCLRTEDTASRLGGDEFGVLLEGRGEAAAAPEVAERIRQAFTEPFRIDGRETVATVSIGIAVASAGDTTELLLRNADAAMYVAKSRGRARCERYEAHMHAAALAHVELRADLHGALQRGELRLVYQPIVNLADGRVLGAEALLRWQHPRRGAVPPLSFIPLAEESGMIVPIGRWVLERAAADLLAWRAQSAGSGSAYVSVNVAARQLHEPGFVRDVVAVMERTGLPAHALMLEITESGLMERSETVYEALRAVRARGVRVAIDDFGTGYSSLEYLERLPVDVLKIPKTFVDGLKRPNADNPLPRAILSIASTLGLEAVAEGIETADQGRMLLARGCLHGQGFFLGAPMPLEALIAFAGAPHLAPERARTPARS